MRNEHIDFRACQGTNDAAERDGRNQIGVMRHCLGVPPRKLHEPDTAQANNPR